jgi:hypothetical protein
MRPRFIGRLKGRPVVPTLFRFFAFLAILAGIAFAGMVALVTFVEPQQREMIEVVPPAKLQPR